jgi:hypothetical protein
MFAKSLAPIENQIAALRRQLEAHPLFQELSILEETRDKLKRIAQGADDIKVKITDSATIKVLTGTPEWRRKPRNGNAVTLLEAVSHALESVGHPLTTKELVDILPNHGATVGGKKPLANLTSIMSKRGDPIHSVKWHERTAWWFNNREIPVGHNGSAPNELL